MNRITYINNEYSKRKAETDEFQPGSKFVRYPVNGNYVPIQHNALSRAIHTNCTC